MRHVVEIELNGT